MSTINVEQGLGALRARFPDQVVAPDDQDWDDARRAWNLATDQRPAAVVFPQSADEVRAVVTIARDAGLRVAAQGTGHGAAALGRLDDTLLVRTSRMRGVSIDPSARRARVEAGVEWAEVTAPAGEHGLAALHGSSPDVGVVGYSLGGGMGWLARRHGFAANSVLAVELVTADGQFVRADADSHPELFWALRGGGGAFGLVTAMEFALYPVRELYAGAMFWPWERAAEVLHRWSGWVTGLPDTVTTVARVMQFPPLPDIPEALRGGSFAVVEAACLDDEETSAPLLEPLRALAPAMDTFATVPAPTLGQLHMDPPEPVPFIGGHSLLTGLTADAVDALLGVAGPGSGSPLLSVELRLLGGALAASDPGHGAVGSYDEQFLLFGVGLAMSDEMATAVEEHLARLVDALRPWASQRRLLNFTDVEDDPRQPFDEETARRLAAVKATYDPMELVRATSAVRPAR